MEFGQILMENNFGQSETYLSTNVKKLVCYESEKLVDETDQELFLNDRVLDWSRIEDICNSKRLSMSHTVVIRSMSVPQNALPFDEFCKLISISFFDSFPKGCSLDSFDYTSAAACLYLVSSAIHNHLVKLTREEFLLKYKPQLEWTAKPDILLHCFDLLKSPQAGYHEASLLLVTCTLERILGDIFMACSEAASCPSLLRDLLEKAELRSVLGETVMHCLEVYIGTPAGLNLRNLAWHGFLSQGELQTRHVSFLLMLTISLGEVVSANKMITKLVERPLITYEKPTLLEEVFPAVQTDYLIKLFCKSNFVTSSMSGVWNLAIDLYKKQRFGDVVILMLPQLEHSLRRVYACCNNLPQRLLTAESSEFYTTFNEILSPLLADGTPNNLPEVIRPCYMEMLMDVLVHQEGPRLRDHISHGEVNMSDFPKQFADHVLNISIAFCQMFCPDKRFLSGAKYFLTVSQAAQSYSSIFHPSSCLRRESFSYINDLLKWKTLPKPSDEDFLCLNDQNLVHITSCKTIIEIILKNNDHPVSSTYDQLTESLNSRYNEMVLGKTFEILARNEQSTLFRPRHELEIVARLRNIVHHCSRASNQIQQTAKSRYEEFQKKGLRSRQRNNYKRFWSLMPFIEQTMVLFAVILATELSNVENITADNMNQIKYLKRCLQWAENMSSLSSSSKNRWQECSDIGKLLVDHVQTYYEVHERKLV